MLCPIGFYTLALGEKGHQDKYRWRQEELAGRADRVREKRGVGGRAKNTLFPQGGCGQEITG